MNDTTSRTAGRWKCKTVVRDETRYQLKERVTQADNRMDINFIQLGAQWRSSRVGQKGFRHRGAHKTGGMGPSFPMNYETR
ncbi:hypothetical protein ZHAS_00010389 [Anopheles sinensis]|uniref:Uncharacterized protein n=1 Tax=Anopheles sinensis TaxID=74873 RepID=A0A084VXG4_ANOSI|nr:hypothetical protein ZHAS_00010389 [Anopheles sinensis]